MKCLRVVAALAVFLFVARASTATCPTTAPTFSLVVSFAGVNCASSLGGGNCGIGQAVEFNAVWAGFGDPPQPCDVITWNFGDGMLETEAPGVMNATHVYASAGTYPVTLSVTNSLGTRTFFVSTPTVSVANGFIQFANCCGITANEGSAASFAVQRTSSAGTASVHYDTGDGTATAGHQYVATSGTVTFAEGETQKVVNVPTIDDGSFHPNLSFRLTLSAPTGGFLLRSIDQFATIIDGDPRPIVGFESTIVTVSESVGSATPRILRTGDTSTVVSVSYFVQNSSGNATIQSSGIVTFFEGETSKTIPVPILKTDTYDGDRSAFVFLSSATNGATFTGSTSALINVKDDQPEPVVTFDNVSVTEGNSGTKTVNVGITLSNPAGFGIFVRPVLVDGSAHQFRDFNFVGNSVNIPAGQTTASFPVQILGNKTVEINKQFTINGTVTRECCTFVSWHTQPGTGTILNDDAGLAPARLSMALGDTQQFTINLGAAPDTTQLFALSSSDPSVATVPASVSGSTPFIPIDVTAKSGGVATITVSLPAAYGGGTLTEEIYVYEGAVLILSPSSISLPVGGTATISASMRPTLGVPEGASLKGTGPGKVTIPDRVIVDAGQTSTFTITAVQHGHVELVATLGANRGNAQAFVSIDVTDPPTSPAITQVVPTNGPAAGGTAVTLNGLNLRNDCTISVGGVPAANISFVSASSMTATTPEHTAGPADVTLTCGTDQFNFVNAFTYLAAAPTLSNVTPSFGTTEGNTLVTITGSNFASGCWPFFDGIPARAATVNSPGTMTAATPAHAAAATVPLALRCSGVSDASLVNAFTYSSAAESSPVITAVDPLIGSSGKPVTISGARFRYDDTVTFDSTPATILSTSPGTHVVRIPDLPLGRISITVTELRGSASTTGPIFTIVEPQPPQINTISPATTRPANEVTLDGSGFRPGYSFQIGDQPATILSLTYTRVVLRVPQLAPGAYGVNILNAASKIAAVGPQVNILPAGLAVTMVVSSCATTDGGAQMSISGTGFAAGALVTFDGVAAASATVANPQTINVTLPPLSAGTPRIVVTNANGDWASLSNAVKVVSPFDPSGCSPRARGARH